MIARPDLEAIIEGLIEKNKPAEHARSTNDAAPVNQCRIAGTRTTSRVAMTSSSARRL
jgi:hypothetical protein